MPRDESTRGAGRTPTSRSLVSVRGHTHILPERLRKASWQREELRTTLWLVPTLLVASSVGLFAVTYGLDVAAYHHHLSYPFWIRTPSADAAREVLIAIAAAVITVVGVVFSITILALTLASQQFGPRMMRNFVRDVGNQMTLGVWVATFVYSVLALGSISTSSGPLGDFVPNLSITVAEAMLFVDVAVLIYFIHHIAKSIQLPEVIAGIARDLFAAVDAEFPKEAPVGSSGSPEAEDLAQTVRLLNAQGVTMPAIESGYLQFVAFSQLVDIAEDAGAVIRLAHRPGHFVVAGRPLGTVWPASSAPRVERALARSHVTGPHRTLIQDPVFAIDQLVEIAIRALSPAVNDTFTALTCIDWLSAGLSRISGRVLSEGVYRDRGGMIRLIEFAPSYERMVNRAFDKVRQAGGRMPAVVIRMLDAISHVAEYAREPSQRAVLRRQADMILRGAEEAELEKNDLSDIIARYGHLLDLLARPLEGGREPSHQGTGADGHRPDDRRDASGQGAGSGPPELVERPDPLSVPLPGDR
ncbi:MAG TPA: DUF2254 domain-containing protein [Acidimicrobiales bacterium]|nr:DUF2254 domain-containing protein [Acidimicrobiales bacterium]